MSLKLLPKSQAKEYRGFRMVDADETTIMKKNDIICANDNSPIDVDRCDGEGVIVGGWSGSPFWGCIKEYYAGSSKVKYVSLWRPCREYTPSHWADPVPLP